MRTFLASLLVAGFCLACAQSNQSLLTVLASLEIAAGPIVATCDTVSVTGSITTGAGLQPTAGSTFLTVRNGTTSSGLFTTHNIGMMFSSPNYTVCRAPQRFDLSGLDAGLDVTACTLYLKGSGDNSATDFYVRVVPGTFTGDPDVEWFNDFVGWASSGGYTLSTSYVDSWNTSSFTAGWNALTFNATGIDSVKSHLGSEVPFAIMMVSSRDATPETPSGLELVGFVNNPFLHIEYTGAGSGGPTPRRTVVLSDGVPIPIMFDGSLTPLLVP